MVIVVVTAGGGEGWVRAGEGRRAGVRPGLLALSVSLGSFTGRMIS